MVVGPGKKACSEAAAEEKKTLVKISHKILIMILQDHGKDHA